MEQLLTKLLMVIGKFNLDADICNVEVRNIIPESGNVDENTVKVITNNTWNGKQATVNILAHRVGLYGQWFNLWRPKNNLHELTTLTMDDM